MLILLTELLHNLANLLATAGNGAARLGRITAGFTAKSVRAHFNLLGQYTAPIEQELFDVEEPPTPRSLNLIGQIALTLLPINPLAWFLSITLVPAVYNATLLLVVLYARLCNLALPDNPRFQLKVPEGSMPWYRQMYGVAGVVLALLAGLPSMAAIAFGRMLVNSWSSLKVGYSFIVNPLFDADNQITLDKSIQEDKFLNKYGFGLPGFVLGALAGFLAAGGIINWRTLKNSALTASRIVFSAGFIVFNGESAREGGIETDGRVNYLKYGFGAPGAVIGALLALPSMAASLFLRVAYNAWFSIPLAWFRLTDPLHIDAGLREPGEILIDGIAKRTPLNKYLFGAPGLLIGSLAALFTSTFVAGWLILKNSGLSAVRLIYSAGFLAWNDERAQNGGIEDDVNGSKRKLHHIFGYGLPGLVLGAPFAALSMGLVALTRTFKQSSLTAWHIVYSAGFVVFNGEPAKDGGIENDNRSSFAKFGIGAPGALIGALLALPSMAASLFLRVAYNAWFSIPLAWFRLTDPLHIDAGLREPGEILIDEIAKRTPLNKYLFGAPGLLIGSLAALFTSTFVAGWLILKNSGLSAVRLIYSAGFLAWNDERAQNGGIEDDVNGSKRKLHHIFGYGLPGLVLGAPFAALSMGLVALTRTFKQSSLTAWHIVYSAGFVVFNGEPAKDGGIENDNRSSFAKFGIGAPGALIGALLALPSMAASLFLRVAYNAWFSIPLAWFRLTDPLHIDAGLREPGEILIDEIAKRTPLNKYLFGAPGLLIGSLAALFTSTFVAGWLILKNSGLSAVRLIYSAGFLAWNDERAQNGGIEDDVNGSKRKLHHIFGYGLPGLVLGAPFAALSMGLVALTRTFKQSSLTAWHIVYSAGFVVFNGEPAKDGGIENDNRSSFAKFGIGAPGALIGALLALPSMAASLFLRVAYNAWFSIPLAWFRLTDPLHIDAGLREPGEILIDEIAKRTPLNKYLFGAPGLLIGSLAALFTSTFVAGWLILKNSGLSAVRLIYSAGFLAWNDERAQNGGIEDDVNGSKRKLHHIFGYGLPGLVLGAPFAALSMGLVALTRTFKQSSLTAWHIVYSAGFVVFNGEPAKDGGIENDNRSSFAKFGIGAPGALIGALLALPSMAASLFLRVAYNAWFSIPLAWFRLTDPLHIDAGLREPGEILIDEIAKRTPLNKYLFGAPGLLIGSLAALFTSTFVAGWLILKNSGLSAVRLIYSAGFLAWNDERAQNGGIEDDVNGSKRKLHHIFGYGLPGLVLGAPFAALSMGLVALTRTFKQSSLTAWHIVYSAGFVVFNGEPAKDGGIENDNRSSFAKFGIGAPGALIGALLALPSMAASLFLRVAYNAWFSIPLAWFRLTDPLHIDAGLREPGEILIDEIAKRTPLNKYLFGAPGLLIGSLAALFTSTFVAGWLILKNSGLSAVRLIYSAGFLAWNDERAQNGGIEDDVRNQQRKLYHIFGYGLPGLVLGAPMAATGAALVVGFRMFRESWIAFTALSGSFLNGALGMPQFAGLAGDKRSLRLKITGTPGYLLAVVLTLPLSMLIFAGKFIAPNSVFFVIGTALSPIVAVIKWLNLGLGRARFEPSTPSVETEQRFKNLYSSLNGWGQLPENGVIQEHADGRKGPLCFTRKAVTLNVASLPERVLDELLQAWRQSRDKERFFEANGEFDEAIREIHAHYAALNCLEFQNTVDERTRHIDELGTFIKQYLMSGHAPVPPRSQQDYSWSATFYGRQRSEAVPSSVLDSVPLAAASTAS
ncbi:hypothetical protein E4T54_01970 [Legionella geestiana]|nr:hypothetical protein [Legionella geestiana]QBS11601.1 hypothetical protein E4T54_01970 [Legionella geestiana]